MIQFETKPGTKHLLNEDLISAAEKQKTGYIRLFFADGQVLVWGQDEMDQDKLWHIIEIAMSNRKNIYRVDPGERTKP